MEELFINFIVSIDVRTSKVIRLSNGFFHFETIQYSQGYIIVEDRLDF